MYHRVLPDGHPERDGEQPGMYVSPDTLAMHVRTLASFGFRFVHLEDWLDNSQRIKPSNDPCCALTFDDGWRDTFQYAAPVLTDAGVPATVFVVADMVGTSNSFWPNRLARLLRGGGPQVYKALPPWMRSALGQSFDICGPLGAEALDAIILKCKGFTDAEMLEVVARAEAAQDAPPPSVGRLLMTWEEIRELTRRDRFRVGSHTRNHTRLSIEESADALHDEIVGSARIISENIGVRPKVFCYPNGDLSAEAVKCVRSAYAGAVTTARGWCAPSADRHLLPRIAIHEDATRGPRPFVARISGWL